MPHEPAWRPPSVDRVLAWPAIASLCALHGRMLVRDCIREVLEAWRASAAAKDIAPASAAQPIAFDDAALVQAIDTCVAQRTAPALRRVFNLTGTVLHTNLGRAPLPQEAIDAMVQVAAGASNLEYDLDAGVRGDRDTHVEARLCRLTGAEAATVVNNNAAAVLLMLNTLGLQREVIVSRGELIEIGGAFRLPDIMRRAQCRLREVGTTNRTHLHDFEDAIGARTALLMKAHASNYRIEGFSAEPAEADLAALAQARGLPFIVDLGSGSLVDLRRFGLPHEPMPSASLANGVDLVSFSGDKLLGGPQVGIVVGRRDLIARLKKNPMKRAMRCDKLTLAALDAVLRLYEDPDRLAQRVPALRLLTRPQDAMRAQADRLQPVLAAWVATKGRAGAGRDAGVGGPAGALAADVKVDMKADIEVDVVPVRSQIGSGSLPVDLLPSMALRLRPPQGRGAGRRLDALARELRRLPIPVIGRIVDGALLLDLRCLEDADEAAFVAQLQGTP